jgi:hypothetical protein
VGAVRGSFDFGADLGSGDRSTLVRSRIEGDPVSSIGRFRRNLRVLQSASPVISAEGYQHLPESWAKEAKRLAQLRRRRRLAQVMLGLMGTTLFLGLIPTLRFLLVVHVLLDLAFAGYIAMLVQARRLQIAERKRARRIAARIRAEHAAHAAEQMSDVQHQAL